jgi:dTDP-3-amino-3,4,6-trideoxy-alpha-D-glucose transaminase
MGLPARPPFAASRQGSVAEMTIRLFDTEDLLESVRDEIEPAIRRVIDSGRFVLGPEVESFEHEFAEYLGAGHAVGVGNGTDALVIALRALGVSPGDEVVVPSFTFYATAEAVVAAGARPVFCDIDPETFCVTGETVERAMTSRTRAIVPVHLFGTPAPIDELRALLGARDVAILEDAAQAAGARLDGKRVGSLGDAATFSFFPSKNLFCIGDGGAIVTDDEEVAKRARLLRLHGSRDKQSYSDVGYNSRLDALQAAVVRTLLPHLDGWNARRRALAAAYEEAGLGELVTVPRTSPAAETAPHMYVVRTDRRDELLAALGSAGIESRALYVRPVHRQPPMQPYANGVELSGTDLAAATNLALPMGATRDRDTATTVVEALRQAVNSR